MKASSHLQKRTEGDDVVAMETRNTGDKHTTLGL